jgi:hypothetical protein
MVIYLGQSLLSGSSGILYADLLAGRRAQISRACANQLLAAGGVYHHVLSPVREAVLRLLFSLSVASKRGVAV